MRLKDFKCDMCGECCRHLDSIPQATNMHINGICKFLKGNLCSIYENRPLECNRFKLFETLKDKISEDEFIRINKYYCEKLKQISENK